ncbi:bifunctional DNA primase/polymerase [Gordonia polyisoprenivorans]|uniref:bifunctional DNA primase/polymerase n=1 Tax=Gordonia polyisoprenivorans TaxID=84595 RepID=UPI000B99E724|nr:bifunctional DNA primase/polymerase [Gordonia polyisoprenivorans]OZC29936.1 hypothetical protein CJJ17_25115 [Gordonia polyisoprenivorans]QUD81029.1 bifunctional DNA primase/polymerase [Gordonia polyisoprenivorans]
MTQPKAAARDGHLGRPGDEDDVADKRTPYADAARLYPALGWRGVLPLPARRKWPPPDGFTGADGVDPSGADVAEWTANKADGNVCLRLPETVVGIDVDAYGSKPGADTLADVESRYGTMPETVMATSRTDGVSGIRLFHMPDGMVARRSIVGPGIEVVRRGHRYAMVWPSIHPDTGETYRWLNSVTGDETAIPAPADLPVLPETWARFLAEGAEPTAKGDGSTLALTDGTPTPAVSAALDAAIADIATGASRHDAMLAHVLTLLRLAEAREDGTAAAIATLGDVFVGAIGDRSSPAAARAEFDRIVEGGRAIVAGDPQHRRGRGRELRQPAEIADGRRRRRRVLEIA